VRGISRIAKDLLASQEGLCSMELVIKFIVLFSHRVFCTTTAADDDGHS
jgi:hypothetical protein